MQTHHNNENRTSLVPTDEKTNKQNHRLRTLSLLQEADVMALRKIESKFINTGELWLDDAYEVMETDNWFHVVEKKDHFKPEIAALRRKNKPSK